MGSDVDGLRLRDRSLRLGWLRHGLLKVPDCNVGSVDPGIRTTAGSREWFAGKKFVLNGSPQTVKETCAFVCACMFRSCQIWNLFYNIYCAIGIILSYIQHKFIILLI